jgi:hypothetical protein
MGWSSGNEIFDPVAWALMNNQVPEDAQTEILSVLIDRLQDGDWDTEDESLYEFRNFPAIVEAFRRNGIEAEEYDY